MDKFEMIIPTLLGVEAFVSKEVKRMGCEVSSVEDGRVCFLGDRLDLCRANIGIRTGERVLIKIGEFKALSFTELFDNVYALPWDEWIDKNGAFPVKGYCLKSKLASVPDCQAIIKKAVAKKLGDKYGLERMPEDGALYQIQFSIMKDRVTVMIDSSGAPLHKRGYRQNSNTAPLRETIAAAMVMLSYWKFENPLCDPFCGSGTIPIEAAMFKRNIAPGLMRGFAAEQFMGFDAKLWENAREWARDLARNTPLEIYASDIDPMCVELTKANADKAGVGDLITVERKDARKIAFERADGSIICNPPYGERMGDKKECERLYKEIGRAFEALPNWDKYILVPNEGFEGLYGRKADKKRKIYNGMLRCNVYQYFKKVRS